ncbi:lactonase family protein [Alteromonas confluentis]|uniref:6-phosphogluconolactonase n=1 Tax=Alteromonas confluentis TaxID=1656094 RepID=A0A1E7ZB11_9ALTE|nr:beta-propeller fold lactonase family protein [Alteromonas confluentis]OFC70651.1 hypothetical protein BFC18_12205 [Alteromonas confluentis]
MRILPRRVKSLLIFTVLSLIAATGHGEPVQPVAGNSLVYVSNAKSGTITRYLLNEEKATLTFLGRTQAGENVMPMAVSPDKQHLYAGVRAKPHQVFSYQITYPSGELIQVGNAPLPASMASIDTDKTGRFLLSASYGDSLLSVSEINRDGVVTGPALQTIGTGRNAHRVQTSPNNRFAISTALGDDQLGIFRFDEQSGLLTPGIPATVATPTHSGPRHFVFAPNQPLVYVLGELSGTVSTYRFDENDGSLTLVGTTNGIPVAELNLRNRLNEYADADDTRQPIWAADIHVSPDGKYLYVSERTRSVITTLRVDKNSGLPTYAGLTEVETQPRGFNLSEDGRFMVVAGEKASSVGLYRLNAETGLAKKVDEAPTDAGANWVEIITVIE